VGSAEGATDPLGWLEGKAPASEGAMDTEGLLLTEGRRLGWEVGSALVVGITLGWPDGIKDVLGRMLLSMEGRRLGREVGSALVVGITLGWPDGIKDVLGRMLSTKDGPTLGLDDGEVDDEGE